MDEYTNDQWTEAEQDAVEELEKRGIDATANPDLVDALARYWLTEGNYDEEEACTQTSP